MGHYQIGYFVPADGSLDPAIEERLSEVNQIAYPSLSWLLRGAIFGLTRFVHLTTRRIDARLAAALRPINSPRGNAGGNGRWVDGLLSHARGGSAKCNLLRNSNHRVKRFKILGDRLKATE